MGCICSNQSALSTAVQQEIDAPCDIVWEVVSDIENVPLTVRNVDKVEFMDNVSEFAVGTKWKETRRVGKEPYFTQIKTIARIEKEEYPRSFSLNISFPNKEGKGTEDIENTCTFTVTPVSETTSVLILSIGFASKDNTLSCCSCLVLKYAEKYLGDEVEDYANAAMKRQEEKQAANQ